MSIARDLDEQEPPMQAAVAAGVSSTQDFDFVVRAAGRLCNVPQAFIAFIDHDTVWIKASIDYLPFSQVPRRATYGELALADEGLVVVPDVHADPRTADHPFTKAKTGFCMYAAVAIRAPDGRPIGVLSLMDTKPRELDAEERQWLAQLGRQASALVEWRNQCQQLEAALMSHERATRLDPLTSLPSRPWLMAKIDEECMRAERFGHPLALMLFDIDDLGHVNRDLGREAGDAILSKIGLLLRQSLRTTDTAGRLSGDRFCVVLPNTDSTGAATLAETLRGRIARQSEALGQAFAITASFGIGASDLGYGTDSSSLMAATSAALDMARHGGRDCVCIAEHGLAEQ